MSFGLDLTYLSFENWVTIGSACVAGLSFIFNWRLVRKQQKREVEALRLQKDADLIAWADDAIDTLAEIQGLLRDRARLIDEPSFLQGRSQLRTRLSAVIDRGRLFFPTATDDDTETNETAYHGDDDPVIAALNEAQLVLKNVDLETHRYDRDTVLKLVEARRQFVSRVFDAVDPRRRAQVFRALD